jgi:hypothetical protein
MRPTTDTAKKASGTFRPAVARPPLGIPVSLPEPPEYLTEAARQEWAYIVPELQQSGVLARADRQMLAIYCELTAEFAADPRKMSAGKLKEMRMICAEFGMTISSRLKIKAPEGAQPPEETWTPKSDGNVVTIAGLRSSMRKASATGESKPASTSDGPANAS